MINIICIQALLPFREKICPSFSEETSSACNLGNQMCDCLSYPHYLLPLKKGTFPLKTTVDCVYGDYRKILFPVLIYNQLFNAFLCLRSQKLNSCENLCWIYSRFSNIMKKRVIFYSKLTYRHLIVF